MEGNFLFKNIAVIPTHTMSFRLVVFNYLKRLNSELSQTETN